jgi:SAM-dependent methyltransferase
MAHPQQIDFCMSVKNKYPIYFTNKRVLDCGSLDINGNNRYLFTDCWYLGIDVSEGNNVDFVIPIHKFNYPNESFDVIISTECFEHDMYYEKSLKNICRLLKPNGLFLFTCATDGRGEHGTQRTTPENSPMTALSNYYKNLNQNDIMNCIDIDKIFIQYEFSTNNNPCDLYFWGIKKNIKND